MPEETGAQQGVAGAENAPENTTVTTEEAQKTEGEAQSGAQAEEGKEPAKKSPWFQRRIDQLTGEKYDLKHHNEALINQNAELIKRLSTGERAEDDSAARSLSAADIDRLAMKRAGEIAAQRAFDDACNKAYAAGKSEFSDFDTALQNLKMLGGAPVGLLEIATDLKDGHKVLYHLAKNPDEAERVFALPPTKQAVELARMETQLGKAPSRPISNAPAPITPIGGVSKEATGDPEKMTMDEFIKWREKRS